MHICDNKCFYYPENPSKILKEYIDDFGIKHRESEFLCCLDGHRILKYKKCKKDLPCSHKPLHVNPFSVV